jgi:hypothetical protein
VAWGIAARWVVLVGKLVEKAFVWLDDKNHWTQKSAA